MDFGPFFLYAAIPRSRSRALKVDNHTIVDEETRKEAAWRYVGYPGFARWMASTNDFFILRRFGALNARVLLLMQDRIVQKEKRLLEIDQQVRDSEGGSQRSDSLRLDVGSAREQILDDLALLLER